MDKKFNYNKYKHRNQSFQIYKQTYNIQNSNRKCICKNYNENKTLQCFKCKQKIHICAKVQNNRPQINKFQCLTCISRNMDLVYKPNNILLQTYYKTQNIFEKENQINFQFNLKYQQLKYSIDIRGFKGSKTQLNWPMQGQFFLNGSDNILFSLKPLKTNSNRKNRKEDIFTIQSKYLKEGKNILTFKIPRIQNQGGIFTNFFQFEQTGIYFIGIYSVKEMKKEEIVNATLRQRRHQKEKTIQILKKIIGEDLQVERQKIKFIDPYTCQRINFPVRGRYCRHLTAVCLINFMTIQKNTRSWKCPICGSLLNQPYVDIWMYQMLKQNSKGTGVYINPDGTYQWQIQIQNVQQIESDSGSPPHRPNQSNVFNSYQLQIIDRLPHLEIIQEENLVSQNINQIDLIDYNNHQIVNQNLEQSIINLDQVQGQPIIQEQVNANQNSKIQNQIEQQLFRNQFIEQDNFQFPQLPNNNVQSIKIQQATQKALQRQKQKNSQTIPNKINAQIYKQQMNIQCKKQINKFLKPNQESRIKQILQKSRNKKNINQIKGEQKKTQKEKQFVQGNKRLLNRPTYKQQKRQQIIKNSRILTSSNNQSISFGNVKKKIQLSQLNNSLNKNKNSLSLNRNNLNQSNVFRNKSEPKKQLQFLQISQRSVKYECNYMRNNENKIKQNLLKNIKRLQFQQITQNRFMKKYCNIPLNPYGKIMDQGMKKIFKLIL